MLTAMQLMLTAMQLMLTAMQLMLTAEGMKNVKQTIEINNVLSYFNT
jgi:hypothetical protein